MLITLQGSDYVLREVLQQNTRSVLYRGFRRADERAVVVKVLEPKHYRARDLEQLEHEFAIGNRLQQTDAAVHPIALDTQAASPALIFEDFGGQSLDQLPRPMAVGDFLSLAVRVAGALEAVHRQHVVHKDIKPHNIVLQPDSGRVQLTDFGIATYLHGDHCVASSSFIEGSLAYLSPEQTGRMNRAVDYRSDLYSLGVTFYEMLTGRLPFLAHDSLEWIHCHVAMTPPEACAINHRVPVVLSNIVVKLLAKMGEDRYQTTRGLIVDLERCGRAWRDGGKIDAFPLGSHDIPDHFALPQKLYGRDAEVRSLTEMFARVRHSGRCEVMVVAGYSGVGKSSLVSELYRPIIVENGKFVAGKFDQYQRHIPYFSVAQAIADLVAQVLAENEAVLEDHRQRLKEAIGQNGAVITAVVPEAALLLGPQPPLTAMGPAAARNRFNMVFLNFVKVFAQQSHPLVIFLDDMQWADAATVELLHALLTSPDLGHLLFILAYRSNEVSRAHPFSGFLGQLREAAVPTVQVALRPLQVDDLSALICDTLRCTPAVALPLAQLVARKTDGNPFFVGEFLKALHRDGLLTFDAQRERWTWSQAALDAKNITDNVVDLMIERLRLLPPKTQETLRLAACIGNAFDLGCLSQAQGLDVASAGADLEAALGANLILQLSSDPEAPRQNLYKFQHDRIQQAAYALLEDERKMVLHLKIGTLLRDRLRPDDPDIKLFAVVSHLNLASSLIKDDAEVAALVALNVQAGTRSKAATAFNAAQKYFRAATDLLPLEAWETQYAQTFALYRERAECEYLSRHIAAAEALFKRILKRARDRLDLVSIYHLQIRLLQGASRYSDASAVCATALQLFDMALPEAPAALGQAMQAERTAIAEVFGTRPAADVLQLPRVADPEIRAFIGLLEVSSAPLFVSRAQVFPLVALKMARLSMQYGNCEASCYAYSCYGLLLASLFDDVPRGYAFAQAAVRLNEAFDDPKLRGAVIHVFGNHVNFWKEHMTTVMPMLEKAFRACQECGDFEYANYIGYQLSWQMFERGEPLAAVLESTERYLTFARQSKAAHIAHVLRFEQQLVRSLQDETQGLLDGEGFVAAEQLQALRRSDFQTGVGYCMIMQMIAAYFRGDVALALQLAAQLRPMEPYFLSMPAQLTYTCFHALCCAADFDAADASSREGHLQLLDDYGQRLDHWAKDCPANTFHRALLVRAERARVAGHVGAALGAYEAAMDAAQSQGFVQFEALSAELCGRLLSRLGAQRAAATYLRSARRLYGNWGALHKVAALDAEFPALLEQGLADAVQTTSVTPTQQLDLLSVVKASQTISSEMLLSSLLETMMHIVIEYAGAQRGYLILSHDQELWVEAEVAVQDDRSVPVTKATQIGPDTAFLPLSIVNYVKHAKDKVLLVNAARDNRFSADPYIVRHQPKSVLCLPVARHAELTGMFYLENNLLAGAFSDNRLMVLELLASQIAISIDNSRLYKASQDAIRARDEFLSIASHELKTPLTPLKLQLQSLIKNLQRGSLSTLGPERLGRILISSDVQVRRLTQLIEDLLDVSRINSGKLTLRVERFDLGDMVREVRERFAEQLQAAQCAVELDLHPVEGCWDRMRLEQVVSNLLANSMKYAAGKPIRIAVRRDGTVALLHVSDQGIGIAEGYCEKVFNRFERATSSKNIGGLGLGLYICRQIVLAHGGEISVRSAAGSGAAFTVRLPIDETAASADTLH